MRLFEGTKYDRPPTCDRCGELEDDCQCPPEQPQAMPPEKQMAQLAVEKRKRGKLMTVIRGLDPTGDQLKTLLSEIKNHCGAGGTIAEQQIEIQGDHRQRIGSWLKSKGFRVR